MRTIKEIIAKVLIGAFIMYVGFVVYNKVKVKAYCDMAIEVIYNNEQRDTFDLVVAIDSNSVYLKEGDIKYRPYFGSNHSLVVASYVRRYRIISYQEHKIK